MSNWRKGRTATIVVSLVAVVLVATTSFVLLADKEAAKREGRESAMLVEDESGGVGRMKVIPGQNRRFHEPQPNDDGVRETIAAVLRGETIVDKPNSAAIARVMERLQRERGPADEVFALITVSDRNTGERRVTTRGKAEPNMARFIREPETAPEGFAYAEGESVQANEEVEIVVRSVTRREIERGPAAPRSRQEQEELELRERNQGGGMSHRIEQGLRKRVKSGDLDLSSHQMVPVRIEMKDVPRLRLPKTGDLAVGGMLMVGLDIAAERERAIIERKGKMREKQRDLVQALEIEGGELTYASWTSGGVEAKVPAKAIRSLVARGDVFSIEYLEPMVEVSHRYQGNDYYVAMDAQDYDPWHAGTHGNAAKHPYTSRVVLALGEQCIDQGNPSYLTCNGCWDRAWYYDCDPAGPCTQGGVEACSGANGHGTRVAQLMTGDFMDNQSPMNTANGTARILTGTCEECRFFFLQDQNLNQRSKVEDAACDLGVDIFESSIATIATSCTGNGSRDGNIQAMINCDVVYVQAAGNSGSGGGCTTKYPADHPWTFAVGGMESQDPCNTSGAYYTADCPYSPNASKGGWPYDGVGTASIIDQTGPYRMGNLINPLTRNPVTFTNGSGTSYATPIVAGLMGRFQDWWRVHVSNSIFYDNRLRNYFLLFGDRSVFAAGTSRALNFHDTRWGSGRVGLVAFDWEPVWNLYRWSAVIPRNANWNFSHSLQPGEDFYKAVVWHTGTDYTHEPMIGLRLTPQPLGCGPVKSVNRLDSKVMLVYNGDIGGCNSVDVRVRNIGVGFSWARRFHFGSYAENSSERNF
jgi:hypothetical protein